jgi:hypothetical protein
MSGASSTNARKISSTDQSTKSLRSSPLRGGQEPRGRELAERTALAGLRAPS